MNAELNGALRTSQYSTMIKINAFHSLILLKIISHNLLTRIYHLLNVI